MRTFVVVLLVVFLGGCAALDGSPPKYVFEAWKKDGATTASVDADMQACGYRDTRLANDLSASEGVAAEQCMEGKGYTLDMSSYRPNNCYGKYSPYLCNRLWGGRKPQSMPARPSQ